MYLSRGLSNKQTICHRYTCVSSVHMFTICYSIEIFPLTSEWYNISLTSEWYMLIKVLSAKSNKHENN